ncbi:CTP synthase, partial [Candidatus Uhrbacteria bacterium CG_4_9_14_3_um_filter_36_7]
MPQPKYIFVVGGVMSSVGKGVTSASIASILQCCGYKVTNVKCDMYVNIDAGTIRPTEHGEVFVGSDGIEADQDLGNYERFTGNRMSAVNYVTTGQVYQEVIRRERNLEYEGEDVEVVPDIPNEIIRRIQLAQKTNKAEITIIEFGGTVGEYQVLLFLEAARIMKVHYPNDVAFVLVSYLPLPQHVGEMKTKPTQYAIRTLNGAGIMADFLIARGEKTLDEKRRDKLAHVCNLREGTVIATPDVDSIYDIPLLFHEQKLEDRLLDVLHLKKRKKDFQVWENFSHKKKQIRQS